MSIDLCSYLKGKEKKLETDEEWEKEEMCTLEKGLRELVFLFLIIHTFR